MTKIREIAAFIILLFFLVMGGYIYCVFNGTPWARADYKHELNIYLEKYYSDHEITNYDVRYNFKDGNYYADVTLQNEITFEVYPSNSEELHDNYTVSKLEYEMIYNNKKLVNELFGINSRIDFIINAIGIQFKPNENVRYEDTSKLLQEQSQLVIYIDQNFEESEDLYLLFLQITNWLKEQKYNCNVLFKFADNKYYEIPFDKINQIKTITDLEEVSERF